MRTARLVGALNSNDLMRAKVMRLARAPGASAVRRADAPAQLRARAAAAGARRPRGDLRRRRRAHRRAPLHRRARREPSRRSHTLDGHGLKLLAPGGIEPLVITGRDSPALRRRVRRPRHHARGTAASPTSLQAAEPLLRSCGSTWRSCVAVMGDDWPDLPLMSRARFRLRGARTRTSRCAPAAHHVTALRGGHGAGARVLRPAAVRCRALCRAAAHAAWQPGPLKRGSP